MSPEIDDLMSRGAELRDQLLLSTKSTVIGGNSHAHILPFISVRTCRRVVGENQGIASLNPARWNRHIAFAQPRER